MARNNSSGLSVSNMAIPQNKENGGIGSKRNSSMARESDQQYHVRN